MYTPMKTLTEQILAQEAAFMEFDLTTDMGYGQWQGMFMELGASSRRFNGYMIQPQNGKAVELIGYQPSVEEQLSDLFQRHRIH